MTKKKTKKLQQILRARWQLWVVILCAAIIGAVVGVRATYNSAWAQHNVIRLRAERSVKEELAPLRASLTALGFTNLSELDTKCATTQPPEPTVNPQHPNDIPDAPIPVFECSSGVNRYVVLPADAAGKTAFIRQAQELSRTLRANGWTSREDYPTVPWFQSVAGGVDYQPDQLNTKNIGNVHCMVDFFTAFSKPKPPAISLQASCNTADSEFKF